MCTFRKQTYNKLPRELSEYTPMTIVYNTLTCTMIIASVMIAVVVCERVINEEISDGYTHTKGVSCVLYNQLFRVVTSSFIQKSLIKSLMKIELFSKTELHNSIK